MNCSRALPVLCCGAGSLTAGGGRRDTAPPTGLVTPNKLVSQSDQQGGKTVWTIRVSTGSKRGSQLSELAPVQLCLIGQHGSAVLREIQPISELPDASTAPVSSDPVLGTKPVSSTGLPRRSSQSPQAANRIQEAAALRRFQEGSVDEIRFEGPDIGPVASLMIAPNQGTWQVDEITVASSSRRDHSDRFICRDKLGTGLSTAAAFLKPVPSSAVLYGSGEGASILSKEEAWAEHMQGLERYARFKRSVLQTTLGLLCCGAVAAYQLGGTEASRPFLAGGFAGLAYQILLQLSVDAVPGGALPAKQAAPTAGLQRLAGNVSLRVLLLAACAGFWAWQSTGGGPVSLPRSSSRHEAAPLLLAVAGFSMQQVAIVAVAAQKPNR